VLSSPDAKPWEPGSAAPAPTAVDATLATPSPPPITTKAATSGPPAASPSAPAAIAARPPAIAARGPMRGAASEPAITATLKGANNSPFALWAWRMARNIAGVVVAVSARATSAPRARPGARSARGGTSGSRARRWMRAKPASSSTPAASGSSVAAEPGPACSARLRPKSVAPSPSVSATAPGTSRPPR